MQSIQQDTSSSKRIYSEWLKLFAILFMVIDHVGLVFYPDVEMLRKIGRLAFPIFAYQLTLGYQFTSNRTLMLKRLIIFALVSMVPYFLMTGYASLNIFFTLWVGFVAMQLVDNKKYIFLLPFVLALPFFVPMDYGIYGVLSILFFHLLRKNFYLQLLGFAVLTFLYVGSGANALQFNAIIGVMFVPLLVNLKDRFKIHKYFFYAFYPAHMLLIWLLDVAIK